MPRILSSGLAAAALALLAACQPPPETAPPTPVAAPGLGGDLGAASGSPVGGEAAAVAADQVQVEPIPGLGD